jgi:hypothetical protein
MRPDASVIATISTCRTPLIRFCSSASNAGASTGGLPCAPRKVSIAPRRIRSTVSTARPVCSAKTMSRRAISRMVSAMIAARIASSCAAVAATIRTSIATASNCSDLLTERRRLRRSGSVSLIGLLDPGLAQSTPDFDRGQSRPRYRSLPRACRSLRQGC